MATSSVPKTVKAAMDNDSWMLKRINYKGEKRIQLLFERRFPSREKVSKKSFWISRDYFKSRYPKSYSNH